VVARIKTPPVTHFGDCGATQPNPQAINPFVKGSQNGRTSDFGILCRVCAVTTTVLCGAAVGGAAAEKARRKS